MAQWEIRRMRREELDQVVQWAQAEGWNPGMHDAGTYYAVDPEGFLLGVLDGQPIGAISAVRHTPHFGFVGFYLVVPTHRGKSFGLKLWHAAMARLAETVSGLDGVLARERDYAQSGYVKHWQNIRYEGRCLSAMDEPIVGSVRRMGAADLPEVMALDSRVFPAQRQTFLRGWLEQPGSVSLGLYEEGAWQGFGVIRPARHGVRIGPLQAPDGRRAQVLVQALMATQAPGTPVQIDVPDANSAAVQLAERLGMRQVFQTVRMYRGTPLAVDLSQLFGVASFELG